MNSQCFSKQFSIFASLLALRSPESEPSLNQQVVDEKQMFCKREGERETKDGVCLPQPSDPK